MIVPGASPAKGSELGGAAAVDVMQFPLLGGLAGWRVGWAFLLWHFLIEDRVVFSCLFFP
jgi:hypothetical protein